MLKTKNVLTACAEKDDARAPVVAEDVPKFLTEMVKELAVREALPPARPNDRARKKATEALALVVSLQTSFLPNKHSHNLSVDASDDQQATAHKHNHAPRRAQRRRVWSPKARGRLCRSDRIEQK